MQALRQIVCYRQTSLSLSGEASYDIPFLHFHGPYLATLANGIQVAIFFNTKLAVCYSI